MGVPGAYAEKIELELADEAATAALAARLAPLLRTGDLIALDGDLGAGKTAFARALINALPPGAPAASEEVPSPTFTLVQVYERGALTVWHFDLYRLEDPDEVWELGLEEALAEGVSLIEWPDRLGAQIPADRLELRLSLPEVTLPASPPNGDGGAAATRRRAVLTGHGRWAARLAAAASTLAGAPAETRPGGPEAP